ncbi:MAG: hypothetical protein K9J13_06395 [Saprospiraceae bacterium]|nr:hypothetical protein [Saprospiraceae bacterium]
MENLKRKLFAVILVLLVTITSIKAQEYKAIQDAFTQSYTYETAGEYSKAVEVMKKVYTTDSYEINLRLGWLTYLSGLFTESQAYYQKAINIKPYAIEAKFGYVYPVSVLGNWDQVIKQYVEILKIDPQNTLANYRMGSYYYGKEDYISAKKFVQKVVNLYPFDYDSVVLLGWICLKKGEYREAQVLFNKALMIQPGDESATQGLGLIK